MALFPIVSPRLMMTRRYKRSWKVDHPGNAEITQVRIAEFWSAACRLHSANIGRRGIGHQRERSSHSDCGLFVAYFTAFVLLLRRSARSKQKLPKNAQLPNRSISSSRLDEDSTEAVRKSKAATDADLELCPHCGSAVRRGKGPDCPVCDKSPQLIWREGSSSLVQARFDVIVDPTCAAEQFSSRYSKLGIPGPSRG